jgi:hypothetical protein
MAKAYLEGHKTWQAAAEQGKKELRALQSALIKTEAKDVNNVIRGLDRVVTELPNVGERLQSLAKAAAKSDVDAISSGQNATRNAIKRCVDYLSGDALVASVDKNPFVKCSFKKTLATAIAQIQSSCPDIK